MFGRQTLHPPALPQRENDGPAAKVRRLTVTPSPAGGRGGVLQQLPGQPGAFAVFALCRFAVCFAVCFALGSRQLTPRGASLPQLPPALPKELGAAVGSGHAAWPPEPRWARARP